MKEETRLRVINYFWIAVTIFMAICTLYVSIFTIRDTVRMNSQIAVLDKDIARYEAKIELDSIFIESISNDPAFMEKYARERYHMQRPGETVFILEE